MSSTQESNDLIQYIILDTCILNYLSNKYFKNEIISYLTDLTHQGFGLAISDITTFELLSKATKSQEKEITQTLDVFLRFLVQTNVLIGASQLATLYQVSKIPNSQISIADKIIGSTAILSGSLILTADFHDFPRPFFKEKEEKLIFYLKKHKKQMMVLHLLQPNFDVINESMSFR